MAIYPELPQYKDYTDEDLRDMYRLLQTYASQLSLELDTRDAIYNQKVAERVYTAVTVTDIGSPKAGAIAYFTISAKFKGFNGTAWVDLS
jgi:hypothetical protein|tara:strand:- start:147 stop:416 length:270 start_codon:yes stop_codon:yes gene_type:complete